MRLPSEFSRSQLCICTVRTAAPAHWRDFTVTVHLVSSKTGTRSGNVPSHTTEGSTLSGAWAGLQVPRQVAGLSPSGPHLEANATPRSGLLGPFWGLKLESPSRAFCKTRPRRGMLPPTSRPGVLPVSRPRLGQGSRFLFPASAPRSEHGAHRDARCVCPEHLSWEKPQLVLTRT